MPAVDLDAKPIRRVITETDEPGVYLEAETGRELRGV